MPNSNFSPTCKPGYCSLSSSRRAARASTTKISSARAHPEDRSPRTMASPIFPPPKHCNRALICFILLQQSVPRPTPAKGQAGARHHTTRTACSSLCRDLRLQKTKQARDITPPEPPAAVCAETRACRRPFGSTPDPEAQPQHSSEAPLCLFPENP